MTKQTEIKNATHLPAKTANIPSDNTLNKETTEISVPKITKARQYRVKRGDTLSTIAKHYSISTKQLQQHNKIKNPHHLTLGLLLSIPPNGQPRTDVFSSSSHGFIWPLEKIDISSDFDTRHGRHDGIDLRAPKGTKIRAAADGVVDYVGQQRGYGNLVILKHANKIKTLYAHNRDNFVNLGQKVKKGDVIASVGKTGNATGYHVHFEYIRGGRKLNPSKHILPNRYISSAIDKPTTPLN